VIKGRRNIRSNERLGTQVTQPPLQGSAIWSATVHGREPGSIHGDCTPSHAATRSHGPHPKCSYLSGGGGIQLSLPTLQPGSIQAVLLNSYNRSRISRFVPCTSCVLDCCLSVPQVDLWITWPPSILSSPFFPINFLFITQSPSFHSKIPPPQVARNLHSYELSSSI